MRLLIVLMITIFVIFAISCGSSESPDASLPTTTPVPSTSDPEEILDLMASADAAAIWPLLDERMRLVFPTVESLAANFWIEVLIELGPPTAAVSQSTGRLIGLDLYTGVYAFADSDNLALTVLLDDDRQIASMSVVPQHEAPSNYLDYETQAQLSLPFSGEWVAVVSGRTAETNAHVGNIDQRFATDFMVMGDERTFRSDGLTNEDHFCFGQPILSPAAGTVVQTVSNIVDTELGQRNTAEPFGNVVVLDHGNGEFSVLAHLKNGSLSVEEGDAVDQGQPVGLCGNSGNSAEPHLHYQLQDGPVLGGSEGLPAFFNDYSADGEPVELGEPTRGQEVGNQ